MKIGLLCVATNRYTQFVDPLLISADRYFLVDDTVEYCLFTDRCDFRFPVSRKVNCFQIQHEPWPAPTLKRYDYFLSQTGRLSQFDFLFYCDVDMKFVSSIGREILGQRVATLHCGYWDLGNNQYPYDRNPCSNAYIPEGCGEHYFAGAFNGGTSKEFLKLSATIAGWRKQDEAIGYIPVWHDESYLNKYLFLHSPTLILNPSFCYPEQLSLPFDPKLLALEKNHEEIRSSSSLL